MAKSRRTTFGGLSTSLKRLGFEAVKKTGHVIFKHKTGRPVILLPAYQSSETVKPIHQMMVWKQLIDAGIIKSNAGSTKFSVRPGRSIAKGQKEKKKGEALKVKP